MRLPLRAALAGVAVVCTVLGASGGAAVAAPATPAVATPAAVAAPAATTTSCGPSIPNLLPATPWPLRRLNPPAAWPLSRGKGVIVAVIDSGVSATHPKLAGHVLPGKDFLKQGPGTCDESGHGTVVAGIIAASDANVTKGPPFYGIAPDAQILPVRVLPNEQKTDDQALPGRIAQAIVWATDQGAKVINMSLTTPPTRQLAEAISYAESKDVVLVAAAGNEGGTAYGNTALYPAAYPGVVGVAGIDQSGNHVSTSNSGTDIAVSAPGVYIEGPAPRGGGYALYQQGGTSFAAAYVSGVAALVRSYYPSLNAAAVVRRIRLTADPSPYPRDAQLGDGVVDPYRAVSAVLDTGGLALSGRDGLPVPTAATDPLAAAKRAALWISLGGLATAICLLLAAALRRRRPDRPAGPAPAPARAPDGFVPVVGEQLVISAPVVHRTGSSGPVPPG